MCRIILRGKNGIDSDTLSRLHFPAGVPIAVQAFYPAQGAVGHHDLPSRVGSPWRMERKRGRGKVCCGAPLGPPRSVKALASGGRVQGGDQSVFLSCLPARGVCAALYCSGAFLYANRNRLRRKGTRRTAECGRRGSDSHAVASQDIKRFLNHSTLPTCRVFGPPGMLGLPAILLTSLLRRYSEVITGRWSSRAHRHCRPCRTFDHRCN